MMVIELSKFLSQTEVEKFKLPIPPLTNSKETMPEEGRIVEDRVTPTTRSLKQMASQMAHMTRPAQATTSRVLHHPVIMITTLQKERKEPSARSLRLLPKAKLTAVIYSQKLQDR